MSYNIADPQIGPLDVDVEALLGEGESLAFLLDQLGVGLDRRPDDDVPPDGWRVLRQQDSGAVTIGAPVSGSALTWRIAQISTDQHGALITPVSIHPEAFPVRRSRAERAQGLVLRWAELSQDEAEDGVFVIDIVNAGETRWRPDGDPFLVIGTITHPGVEVAGASFGFFGGQNPAVPLDPGEYARVPVTINEAQWAPLEPGRYELHASLVMLPVTTAAPLLLDLTQQQIDERTTRFRSRTRTPAEEAEAHRRNYRRQKALVESASKLEEIARLITSANSIEEATTAVALVLDGDSDAAGDIVHTPLMQFTVEVVQRTRANILQIEEELASLETD